MGATQSCVPCSHGFEAVDISVDEPKPFMQEMKVMKSYKIDDENIFVRNSRAIKKQRQSRSRTRRPQVQDPMYFSSKIEIEPRQSQRQRQSYTQAQQQEPVQVQQATQQKGNAHYQLRGFTKSGKDLKVAPHLTLRGFGSGDIKLKYKKLDPADQVFVGLHGPVTLHEGNLVSYTSLDGHKHVEAAIKAHEVKKSFPNGISYGGLKKSIWFASTEERDRLFDSIGQTFQVFQGIRDTVIVNMYYGVTYTDINGVRYENVTYQKERLRKTFPLGISYGDLPRSIFFADEEERDLTFALMAGRMENPSQETKNTPKVLQSFNGLKFRVDVHEDAHISYTDITGVRRAFVKFDASRIKKTFPQGISYGNLPKSVFFKDEKTRDMCFDLMISKVFTGLHGPVCLTQGKVAYTAITGHRFNQVKFDKEKVLKTFPKGISYGNLPKSVFFETESERDACIAMMRGHLQSSPTAPRKVRKAAPALDSIYTMQFMSKKSVVATESSKLPDSMDIEVSVCDSGVNTVPVEVTETRPVTDYNQVLTDYKCYNYLLSGEENRVEVKIYKDLSLEILQKVAISPTLQSQLFGIDPKLKIQRVYEHGPDLVVVSEHVSLTLKDVLNDNSYSNVSQMAKMYITYELIKSVAELHENGITMKLLSSLSVWICRDGRVTLSGFLEQAMRRLKTQIVCASDDESMEANPLVLLKWRQRDVYRLGQLIARLFVSNNVLQWVKSRLDIPTEFDSYPDVKAVLYQKNVPKSIIQIICRCLRTKREGPLVHASMNEILGYAHYGICNDFDLEAGRQDLARYLDENHERLMF